MTIIPIPNESVDMFLERRIHHNECALELADRKYKLAIEGLAETIKSDKETLFRIKHPEWTDANRAWVLDRAVTWKLISKIGDWSMSFCDGWVGGPTHSSDNMSLRKTLDAAIESLIRQRGSAYKGHYPPIESEVQCMLAHKAPENITELINAIEWNEISMWGSYGTIGIGFTLTNGFVNEDGDQIAGSRKPAWPAIAEWLEKKGMIKPTSRARNAKTNRTRSAKKL